MNIERALNGGRNGVDGDKELPIQYPSAKSAESAKSAACGNRSKTIKMAVTEGERKTAERE